MRFEMDRYGRIVDTLRAISDRRADGQMVKLSAGALYHVLEHVEMNFASQYRIQLKLVLVSCSNLYQYTENLTAKLLLRSKLKYSGFWLVSR